MRLKSWLVGLSSLVFLTLVGLFFAPSPARAACSVNAYGRCVGTCSCQPGYTGQCYCDESYTGQCLPNWSDCTLSSGGGGGPTEPPVGAPNCYGCDGNQGCGECGSNCVSCTETGSPPHCGYICTYGGTCTQWSAWGECDGCYRYKTCEAGSANQQQRQCDSSCGGETSGCANTCGAESNDPNGGGCPEGYEYGPKYKDTYTCVKLKFCGGGSKVKGSCYIKPSDDEPLGVKCYGLTGYGCVPISGTPTPTDTAIVDSPTPTFTPTPTDTPTPTPSPTPTAIPWIRLKNTSFSSRNGLINPVPFTPAAFDSDDNASTYFIIGSSANSSGSSLAPVVNVSSYNPDAKTGSPEYKANYSPSPFSLTPNSFYNYVRARKQFTSVSSLGTGGAGIYYYTGASPLTLSSVPALFSSDVVLITSGTVTINVGSFTPAGSIAIIADTINFSPSVTTAEGIFIANTITTGTSQTGLKIVGNLIAQSSFTNGRTRLDPNQPTVFIVFDSQKYLDLLPYLSIANYEWRWLLVKSASC